MGTLALRANPYEDTCRRKRTSGARVGICISPGRGAGGVGRIGLCGNSSSKLPWLWLPKPAAPHAVSHRSGMLFSSDLLAATLLAPSCQAGE